VVQGSLKEFRQADKTLAARAGLQCSPSLHPVFGAVLSGLRWPLSAHKRWLAPENLAK